MLFRSVVKSTGKGRVGGTRAHKTVVGFGFASDWLKKTWNACADWFVILTNSGAQNQSKQISIGSYFDSQSKIAL